MKRSDYPDFAFDEKKFGELVEKAQDILTQTAFAKNANLSTNFINKCIRKKLRTAPTPATIKRIAKASDGRVSYAELLEAAGYDSSKYNIDIIPPIVDDTTYLERTRSLVYEVCTCLSKKGFSYMDIINLDKEIQRYPYQIRSIIFGESDEKSNPSYIKEWRFFFLPPYRTGDNIGSLSRSRHLIEYMRNYNISDYNNANEFDEHFLFSIVVPDEDTADYIKKSFFSNKAPYWIEIIILNVLENSIPNEIDDQIRIAYPMCISHEPYLPTPGKEYDLIASYKLTD